MNRNKKLTLLGLVAVVIGYSIVFGAIGGSGSNPSAIPANSSSFINANYYSQKDPYYCGQASVQMALRMVQEDRVRQFELRDEMKFIPGAGTRNINMNKPFQNRGIDIVRVGLFSGPRHLRKSIDNRQYSIINIRFDIEANSGHYVLVTGYNETGFFVNDPWPEKWGKPTSRDTGENAFIGTEMLLKLWSYRHYWVITVAGPDSINDPIITQAQGVPVCF
jgi:hypothetical protein